MDHDNDELRSPIRALPPDLPTSLDDSRRHSDYMFSGEEVYDAWQGQSQFLTAPVPAKFNFSLDQDDDTDAAERMAASDRKLESMLSSGNGGGGFGHDDLLDEESILADKKLDEGKKKQLLQKALSMAASNGEPDKVDRLLSDPYRKYIDINLPDDEGSGPLIYAACFGHLDVVTKLLDAGANVDVQDKNQWSALMWATTNRHKEIAKVLLDHGASPELKSSTGRTAFDFVSPHSDMSNYLHKEGYIGSAGVADDFYEAGLEEERFEEQMMENEMRRRMMMESSMNLEVDLSSLGLDDQNEAVGIGYEDEEDDGQDFIWDRCLPDQMFVFAEDDLDRILDIIIVNMRPQRSTSQKPVPANVLFLAARYAHWSGAQDLLDKLLFESMEKINNIVEEHQWDMTILAFWISNATLLLYFLKKDTGLVSATIDYQVQLSELINEIYILIVRDAERRMDKVLDQAILEHETIPGFEEIHFKNEWRIFRTKKKPLPEPPMGAKRFRPPSPKRKMQPSPRNVTSLLSSTLFVLDLYDIHSVIVAQILSQLYYWLSAELFNRVMSNRKYLARTKAMQIRLNVSTLEEWARSNNRQAEHYEGGSIHSSGENTVDAAKRHLEPVVQLLQWLQCFTSLGDDFNSLTATIEQLTRLTPQQILHSVKHYRCEVGEKMLPKESMRLLNKQNVDAQDKKRRSRLFGQSPSSPKALEFGADGRPIIPNTLNSTSKDGTTGEEEEDVPENLLLDPALMLPFVLPTSTDMLVSYGAGLGGMNRERERKYQPSLPAEFLSKLDSTNFH